MNDLVKRLREVDPISYPSYAVMTMEEAAAALEAKDAEIAALKAEVARLRADLEEDDAILSPETLEAIRRNSRKAAEAQDRALREWEAHWPALQAKE